MTNYIDGFVFLVPKENLEEYRQVAKKVAEIWKEHGALSYHEFMDDDLTLEGTKSFPKTIGATDAEAVIFGWVEFDSKASRDTANKGVAADPRMTDLVAPLTNPSKMIFDASRMAYGGFRTLIKF